MTALTPELPLDLLGRLYDEEFGLRPTNFSIKPVHIANGLARNLTGRSYRSTALAQVLRRWIRDQKLGLDIERHPTRGVGQTVGVLDRYPEAFEARRDGVIDTTRVNNLRALGFDVLGADGAVFDDPDKSSYTISNERMITRDPSDNRCGQFLARLLVGGGDGDAATLLRDLLQRETDPWTVLALPLLELADNREENPSAEQLQLAGRADHLFALGSNGGFDSPTMQNLRDSFDRLARFERHEGSKLNSLRRLVLFGCFAIHVQMCARWSEASPEAPRPPIVFDMFDGGRPSIRDASRAALRAAGDAIEGRLSERIRDHFSTFVTSEQDARAVLDEQEQLEPQTRRKRFTPELVRRFDVHLEAGLSPAETLAEAFLEVGYEATRGHPVGFLTELGRRAGYLTPWANQGRGGKLQKRYGITAEFLETLVAATVEPDEPLDLPEFLEVLRSNYGIVVGRRGDDEVIRANNLNGATFGTPTSIAEEDLRGNVEALRRSILEIGFAKAYADGQTVITAKPEGHALL
jgi:hypothetical protein